jgi:hypothetical protein
MSLNMEAVLRIRAMATGADGIARLRTGLDQTAAGADRAVGAFGRLRGIGGAVGGVLRQLAPALTVGGLAAIAKNAIDSADALAKMSSRTGVSVETLDKFRQAADLSDTSIEAVGKGLTQLSRSMVAAQGGTGKQAEEFQKLGINIFDANGELRNSGDVMLDLARVFKTMPDGPEKTAAAMALLGRAGVDLIPMLNMGGDAIEGFRAKFSTEFAKAAEGFNDAITNIGESVGRFFGLIVQDGLPAIQAFTNGLNGFANAIADMPEPVRQVLSAVLLLSAALVVIVGTLGLVVGAVAKVAGAFATFGGLIAGLKIGATIAGWAGAILPALTAIGAAIKTFLAIAAGIVAWPVLVVAALVAAAAAIWVFRDQIVAGLQAAMAAIGQWVQGLVQWGEPIRQFWIGLWQGVMEITMGFISWLGSAFSQNILQPIQRALEPVRQLFSTMFQQVQAIASSFFGWWASNLYQMFVEPLDRLLRGLGGLFQQAFSAAGSAIMVGFSTLVRLFNTGVIQPLTTAWTTFVQSLGQAWSAISDAFQSAVVDPIKSAWQGLQDWLAGIVQGAASAVSNAFQSIAGGILGAFRGIIGTVSRIINSIINAINTFIRGVNVVRNAVGLSSFSTIPNVNVEAFAKGGFVKRATLAVVGEGGEPEYIVPESKMAAASANYLTGARGDAVLSAGPSVMAAASPSAVAGGAGGPAQINITTGPVMEFDGRRFATIEDLQSAAQQTATQIYATLRTPAGRRAIGVA